MTRRQRNAPLDGRELNKECIHILLHIFFSIKNGNPKTKLYFHLPRSIDECTQRKLFGYLIIVNFKNILFYAKRLCVGRHL